MKQALCLLLLFSNSLFAQVNLNQGLVAYYPFNGNVNDQSGNNNNPIFNNATLTADRFGNGNSAYSFNGIDNYIRIPNAPSLNPSNQRLNDSQFPYWFNGVTDEVRIYNRALNPDEVNAYGDCSLSSCNNWLSLPSQPSYVNVGDLDIPGDQITVEATINRTTPYVGGSLYAGDIVSKHDNPSDVNYLLRPNSAEITTTNGYFRTPDICEIELNKTYHVAMVYDGSTLKFYRNGFLMSQIAATGNLFQNDWQTRVGYYQNQAYNTNFIGYINEVRIWNVARTQNEIRTYMNTSLPSPTTQAGLLAYYNFNDLTNKQGNSTWNGTLGGSASITATNPNCNFIADSCSIIPVPGTDTIINDYTPVLAFNPCDNKITVEDATAFNVGDTILMIQMKGATIDSSNTSNFGILTNYKNAGNYEFNYVKSKTGNIIELKNVLTRQYDVPDGKVQVVRVPYYQSTDITNTLTCLPWDGKKGGILVLNARDSITLNANIDVSGRGFHGATGYNPQTTTLDCFQNEYNYPISSNGSAAQKGESITTISDNIICGKGSPAAGGGGGLGHNSGGGGGANGGQGGFGGYQLEPCGSAPFDNRGIGGHSLSYSSSTNKIFMGSGGGSGHADNAGNIPSGGGNGGGIIIINSNFLKSNNFKIQSNGSNGIPCTMPPSYDCHDGMGGGGGGGAILLNINQILDNTTIEDKGGNGADMVGSVPLGGRIGAGGGGGGGLLFVKSGSLSPNLTNANSGGVNGVLTTDANNAWGATPGNNGTTLFSLQIPIDSVSFKPNIDSVRIKDSTTGCSSFDFKGLPFTNSNPISTWHWNFGDGGTANTQNTAHSYNTNASSAYTVKIVVADIDGCKDSSSILVTTLDPPVVKTNNDTASCPGIQAQLNVTGAASYSWSPSAGLNDSTIANPVATPISTTQYIVSGTLANGCRAKDTITITVYPKPTITKSNDTAICKNSFAQLFASGGIIYSWSPANTLNNGSIPDPVASPASHTTYVVTVTDSKTCKNSDSINVSILPDPVFTISNPKNACINSSVQLNAGGGNIYSWQPTGSLNDPTIATPTALPLSTTTYSVMITDTVCNNSATLSTIVTVLPLPTVIASKSNDLDCSRDFSQLAATGAFQYVWSPANTLNNPNIANPIAKPTSETLYIVVGTDANGCTNYDSVMVNITGTNKSGYLMPSAFTPNHDGLNDCYGVKYWGVIEELDFGIYNRWGERVFHTTKPGDCWDGTYKGVKQNPDVYVYLITAKTFCGKVFRKGTFVLIR
jgi:gliding motility-associated-like protein